MGRVLAMGGCALVVAVMFWAALGHPVTSSEATAALALVDAGHTGDRIIARQLGETEPRRLPLHTWILGGITGWQSDRVSISVARTVSFVAILLAALLGTRAFGSRRWTTSAIVVLTPAIWGIAVRGTPGALLVLCATFALACYEVGRRLGAPTLQWGLPPILGAAAALVWSPAWLLVGACLLIETIRLAPRRQVSWAHLSIGVLLAIASIAMWHMAYVGFVDHAPDAWSRFSSALWPGDPVLAERTWTQRVSAVAGVFMPVVVLGVLAGWPPRLGQPRRDKDRRSEIRLAPGVVAASWLAVACAFLVPGVPTAIAAPASIAALGVLGRERLVRGPDGRSAAIEIVVAVGLMLAVAVDVIHTPRWVPELPAAITSIEPGAPVIIDRDLSAVEEWAVVDLLGRPASRRPGLNEPAWYVGHAAAGPGLSVTPPTLPEAWSLLSRPLERPVLAESSAALFRERLEQARSAFASNPTDALASIWVGRRLAYLGRFRAAIQHFDDALTRHPDDSRLWRHRGHRYITVREFASAIHDLEHAARLERGRTDRVEPDGLPNAAGIALSTTQGNIWYHLGLAYYVSGDLEQTVRCYREALRLAENDDSWVAAAHWLHIALRRLGREQEAAELLQGLRDEMRVIENDSYETLLRLYVGQIAATEVERTLDSEDGAGQLALAYGLARWYDDQGDEQRAVERYRQIVRQESWAAFGYIAAEVELVRRHRAATPIW